MDAAFEIRVEGHLDARWADWFAGATYTASSDGTTIISVPEIDQAALQGLLRKVADLGLTLISVNAVRRDSIHPWTRPAHPAWLTGVQHVTSADGTAIAVHRSGSGRPVVLVGGAFSTAADGSALAAALIAQGFEAVTFDRRARGDSGDTKPFAPEREAEDVAAVIESVGGSAILLGHSSGALLALLAAANGAQIEHLFLSEPPMRFGKDEPSADLPQRLQALVDEGRSGEAVTAFQLEGIGLPAPMVEQIKASSLFEHLTKLAQSTVYDATIAAATSTPSERLLSIAVPTTVLVGVETMPLLERAAPMLVERMPSAELVQVPESRNHAIDPPATAAIIAERVAGRN